MAIVLGASVWAPGEPSPWLKYRLETAAGLYQSGRVDAILVSGDNSRIDYDEPTAMRDYLVGLGIPSEAIALDYAGFDTYDTCVRAHKIFGVDEALLVSQDFHVSRAVAVCARQEWMLAAWAILGPAKTAALGRPVGCASARPPPRRPGTWPRGASPRWGTGRPPWMTPWRGRGRTAGSEAVRASLISASRAFVGCAARPGRTRVAFLALALTEC